MAITVKIEIDDQGQISVGVDAGDQNEAVTGGSAGGMGMSTGAPAEGTEDQGMQPAASVDEALAKAKELLSGAQTGTQAPGQPQGNMWDRVKRDRQMQRQPGGPMMGMKG